MARARAPHGGRRSGRPPSSDHRASSRGRLIDAAATVFAEKGFRTATVDEIVGAARLSKGTFYWNFDSKEDLFRVLLEQRIDRPVRELIAITRDSPAEKPTAAAVSEGLSRLLERERENVLLLHEYWAAAARDERLSRRYRERLDSLRTVLARALSARHDKTGVPLTTSASSLATAFIALAEGLASEALIDPEGVPEDLFGEILSLVYDGLEARASAGR